MKGKILTFSLNHNIFGIDITLVKEINRNVEFTPIPQAYEHIAGLFNMRGQIVTLIDLAKLFGYSQNETKTKVSCIILKSKPGEVDLAGFLIDKPGEVLDIEEEWCELPPANMNRIEGQYIDQLVKLKEQIVLMINVEKIMQHC